MARRGILAAIWCVESRWAPSGSAVGGDWVTLPDGRRHARALGPLQFHVAWTRACGMKDAERVDLYRSARCWLHHVNKLLPKAARKCGAERAFDVAEATVASGAWRWCGAQTGHVRKLLEWRSR